MTKGDAYVVQADDLAALRFLNNFSMISVLNSFMIGSSCSWYGFIIYHTKNTVKLFFENKNFFRLRGAREIYI